MAGLLPRLSSYPSPSSSSLSLFDVHPTSYYLPARAACLITCSQSCHIVYCSVTPITVRYLPKESTQLGILSFISFGACLALIPGTVLITKLDLINVCLMKTDNILSIDKRKREIRQLFQSHRETGLLAVAAPAPLPFLVPCLGLMRPVLISGL